jgi:hypothetical protein
LFNWTGAIGSALLTFDGNFAKPVRQIIIK